MQSNRTGEEVSRKRQRKSDKYERKLRKTKAKARSELDRFDWNKWQFAKQSYWINSGVDRVPRIDYRTTSKAEFIEKYESKGLPVVMTHVTDTWRAQHSWNYDYFMKRYGSHMFKIGEDDDENNVYMKMKHFLRYSDGEGQQDDSPLYIFDSGFHRDRRKRKTPDQPNRLLEDYEVPSYFDDDLFQLTGERRRPPHRWIVIGGARSGTGIHTDPLGTSAWNALLRGHKRWAMFPPGTPKDIVDPPMKPYDREAVSWFSQVFPKFKVKSPGETQTLGEKLGMVEVLQQPGETIFVPGGWAHVVMNLDMTFAVTQNFCSPTNVELVFLNTRHSRPKLAAKLYRQVERLAKEQPDPYATVLARIDSLKYVPRIPPSSSDSSSSSSSSSSSGSSSDSGIADTRSSKKKKQTQVSSTESETDLSDGTCMCHKCKRNRKVEARNKSALSA